MQTLPVVAATRACSYNTLHRLCCGLWQLRSGCVINTPTLWTAPFHAAAGGQPLQNNPETKFASPIRMDDCDGHASARLGMWVDMLLRAGVCEPWYALVHADRKMDFSQQPLRLTFDQ
jgi:hypothetical protein